MTGYAYTIWILLLPLAGFALMGLFGRRYLRNASGTAGTLLMLVTTGISLFTAYQYFFIDGSQSGVYQKITAFSYTWLPFGDHISIDMGIVIDPLSVMMLVVVSFVSLMVHVFSLGYMKGEKRFSAYYAYLSLFTFSMLALVLAGNLFQVYIFWELVGVSSFLLIGFYYDKPSAVAASKKAFIITRFADLGFLIGILVLSFYGKTLDIQSLITAFTSGSTLADSGITTGTFLGMSAFTWGLLLVFIGGAGKSAMFPLHVWLPDAMEGPTPVSALIHAATMVVAGVYLVARLFPVFSLDHAMMQVITWVGTVSALVAAMIACTQTDIKRVLAYSTMSQIGYMMLALGTSGEDGLGYMASLFHLFTHAFFKSLLFLCAGAVIHLVHSNDMRDMGGLRKLMPLTHICFLVACLAISGIPPFAGFFSKEEILTAAFHSNKIVYGIALFTAGLTAFYMFRLYFSVFWNRPSQADHHHGEGSLSMKLPLLLLAVCTLFTGLLPFASWVTVDGKPSETHVDIAFSIMPVALSIAAILLAMRWYRSESDIPGKVSQAFGGLYRGAAAKFYIDDVYLFVTKRIIFPFVGRPAAWIDRHIVDGTMNGLAWITERCSGALRYWQSGRLQSYALYFFSGIILLSVIFIYLWK
jgi:NADH-quinone oxidoreductase subunit L